MTLPNHLAAGLTFTGIFAAIADINIFAEPKLLIVTLIAAVLPDIDHTASPIGKMVYPFARWLHRRFGHRTLTHSLLALLALSFIVGILEEWFGVNNKCRIVFFFGYLSHIIGDMITVQGVQFFYPFSKSPCVIPGRRELRFRTGNRIHETMLFAGISLTFLFCQPLMQNGFWTTYNRSFGYPKHLWSEFKKSKDLLEVDFAFREGSDIYEGKAYCLEAEENKFTLLEDDKFRILDGSENVILRTIPTHTGRSFRFPQQTFINISSDSLNRLIQGKKIMHLEVNADQDFITILGELKQTGKRYKGDYINETLIFQWDSIPSSPSTVFYSKNPRIQSLQEELTEQQRSHAQKTQEFQQAKSRIIELNELAANTEDLFQREEYINKGNQIRIELDKLKRNFQNTYLKIGDTKRQLRELRIRDQQSFTRTRLQEETKRSKSTVTEAGFTGIVQFVVIEA